MALRLASEDGAETDVELRIADMGEARLVLTEDLIRATLRREKAGRSKPRTKPRRRAGRPQPSRRSPRPLRPRTLRRSKPSRRERRKRPEDQRCDSGAQTRGRGQIEGEDDGRQRQQTRTLADRRRGRAREVDRPLDRARLDGGRDAEGGALALRPGDRGARRDQPEDRRNPLLAPAAGRRPDRERRDPDHAGRRAEEEPFRADRRLDRRIAAALRLRPHSRPGLQAGAGAENPRGRARQAIRRLSRIASARSSTARSSASNTAMSSSISAAPAPARRWCGATK